jgi:predicted amidohydrolase YtcJ
MRVMQYLAAAAALLGATMSAQADTVLISGGAIVIDAKGGGTAEAVVAVDGRITFLGKAAEAKALAKGARVIDLKGGFAYPGFTDSHAHLLGIGLREVTLDLAPVPSLKELQAALAAYAKAHPSGPITGRGWIETHWPEKRFPTRFDIDAVVSDRPVFLERADGHAAVVNSAALKLGGIVRSTANPAGGRIERDAKGEATGMLIDAAMSLVEDEMPEPTAEFRRAALKRGVARVASMGWTGIHNMSVSADELAMQMELATAGALPIRIDNYLDADAGDQVLKSGPYQDATGRVRVRGVKLYVDGALGSRGAALLAPYSDAKTSGLILLQQRDMLSYLARAKTSGAQIAVHAIGDRGNRLVLDAFAKTFGARGGRELRWRIEHAQVVAPQDLPRFAKLGVVASMQPSHAISDLYFAPARLGPMRLKGAYAWKSLLASGATIVGGSDAPVEKGEALEEFYAAIYRHDRKGHAGDDWHLEEAVGRNEALAMFTSAPAYTVFHEREVGTLSIGKQADISVFSVDLLKATPAAIIAGRPLMTIVGGAVVFPAEGSK